MSLPNQTSRVTTGESIGNKGVRGKWILGRALRVSLLVYISSYLALSLQGRYEPELIGVGVVKQFGWAPRGFVTDFRWNYTLIAIYFPLYLLDTRLWHTTEAASSDRYPVNDVTAAEIGRVYEAWKK